MSDNKKFTEQDLDNCWPFYKGYLIDILNGDYVLEEAREDLRGLIGSKYDKRPPKENVQAIKNLAYSYMNENSSLRYGQSVFNAAYTLFPNAADRLRGTNYDCFYNDDKVEEFIKMLFDG